MASIEASTTHSHASVSRLAVARFYLGPRSWRPRPAEASLFCRGFDILARPCVGHFAPASRLPTASSNCRSRTARRCAGFRLRSVSVGPPESPCPTLGFRALPKQRSSTVRGARDLTSVPMACCWSPGSMGRVCDLPKQITSAAHVVRVAARRLFHLVSSSRAERSFRILPKQVAVAVPGARGIDSVSGALCVRLACSTRFRRPTEAGCRHLAGRARLPLDAVAARVLLALCAMPLVTAEAGHSCAVRCTRSPRVAGGA